MVPEDTVHPLIPEGPECLIHGVMVPLDYFIQGKLLKFFDISQ
jgi:hypothetical protein